MNHNWKYIKTAGGFLKVYECENCGMYADQDCYYENLPKAIKPYNKQLTCAQTIMENVIK